MPITAVMGMIHPISVLVVFRVPITGTGRITGLIAAALLVADDLHHLARR